VELASAGTAHVAPDTGEVLAVAEIRPVPSPFEALRIWAYTVVLLSAISLLGPLCIPWLHTDRFNQETSFGKGELLGFALALFAAALGRWLVKEGDRRIGLMVFSIAGMVIVSIMLSLLWYDAYQVETKQTADLFLQLPQVVQISWGLVGLSLFCGGATEVSYARSLQESAVKVTG
jgi:hypothetical protein